MDKKEEQKLIDKAKLWAVLHGDSAVWPADCRLCIRADKNDFHEPLLTKTKWCKFCARQDKIVVATKRNSIKGIPYGEPITYVICSKWKFFED